jgi:membrane fusion protein
MPPSDRVTARTVAVRSDRGQPREAVHDAKPVAVARADGRAPRPSAPSLFRPEAMAGQRTQWLGTVLLARPVSLTVFAAFALIAILAVGLLMGFGEFTRKARVSGWVVPQQGVVRVFAPQPSVVSELLVREGARVQKDQPLLTLSAERQTTAYGATQVEVSRLLATRRTSLQAEQQQQQQLFEQQRTSLRQRIDAMRSEIGQLTQEIALQSSRVQLAEGTLQRERGLQAQGYVSLQQVQTQEGQMLEQRGRLRALERQRSERQRDVSVFEGELLELPLRAQAQRAALERSVSTLEQELAEAESRRQIVVTAPLSGTVSSLQVEAGTTANPATPLMNIVPENARLEVHLFTPSRSMGFVREGQQVLVRYQAYPYQKFGHHAGKVVSVSRTAISPAELPSALAGLAILGGAGEPIYRIVVALERQSVTAYGAEQALQAGMQLEADIALERRKLYEWILEPLYTLTGRL